MPKHRTPLTPKQQRFVAEYLVDLNAVQAAVRAGYSPRTAHSGHSAILTKPSVAAALQLAMAERAAQTARIALDVLKDIQDVTREAREAGDWRAALKGLELEGKHLGMFTYKVDAALQGDLTIRWSDE
jgi:phage terminase small subunit